MERKERNSADFEKTELGQIYLQLADFIRQEEIAGGKQIDEQLMKLKKLEEEKFLAERETAQLLWELKQKQNGLAAKWEKSKNQKIQVDFNTVFNKLDHELKLIDTSEALKKDVAQVIEGINQYETGQTGEDKLALELRAFKQCAEKFMETEKRIPENAEKINEKLTNMQLASKNLPQETAKKINGFLLCYPEIRQKQTVINRVDVIRDNLRRKKAVVHSDYYRSISKVNKAKLNERISEFNQSLAIMNMFIRTSKTSIIDKKKSFLGKQSLQQKAKQQHPSFDDTSFGKLFTRFTVLFRKNEVDQKTNDELLELWQLEKEKYGANCEISELRWKLNNKKEYFNIILENKSSKQKPKKAFDDWFENLNLFDVEQKQKLSQTAPEQGEIKEQIVRELAESIKEYRKAGKNEVAKKVQEIKDCAERIFNAGKQIAIVEDKRNTLLSKMEDELKGSKGEQHRGLKKFVFSIPELSHAQQILSRAEYFRSQLKAGRFPLYVVLRRKSVQIISEEDARKKLANYNQQIMKLKLVIISREQKIAESEKSFFEENRQNLSFEKVNQTKKETVAPEGKGQEHSERLPLSSYLEFSRTEQNPRQVEQVEKVDSKKKCRSSQESRSQPEK